MSTDPANSEFAKTPESESLDAGLFVAYQHAGARAPQDQATQLQGQIIDHKYELQELVGEGGMGSVWKAAQIYPMRRTVAVKLIKPGMDSRSVLARFEAERQALALMDHPHIAKVHDAGVVSSEGRLHGRPYFVMEYIPGTPITKYCDDQRLGPNARLELFSQVCSAVQHAHQKGIIHRDLKPTNVLIGVYDGKPIPKVIDFGVAKATRETLSEHTKLTHLGIVVGTPEYMSPEQATLDNRDIDTRSDIYSLGVLLYELLVGSTPFQGAELRRAGFLEMLRVIREEEPPPPSLKLSSAEALPSISANRNIEPRQLTGILRSELDWVVMKAMEKNRARRYDSASALGDDLQRYLRREPVLARPQSRLYRLGKLLHKHRGFFTALVMILGMLIAGTVISSWLAVERHYALLDAEKANKTAQTEKQTAQNASSRAESKAAEAARERANAVNARELSDIRLYSSQVRLALAEWEHGDPAVALAALERTNPVARHWEYGFLKERFRRDHQPLEPVIGGFHEVALAPHGERFLGVGQAAKIVVGHLSSMTATDQWSVANKRLTSVAWHPDGDQFATGAFGNELKIWSARDGGEIRSLAGHTSHVSCVAYSPDGKQLASGSWDKTIQLWNAESGALERTLSGHEGQVFSISYSPDGNWIASGSQDGDIRIWKVKEESPPHVLRGHEGQVFRVRFSPDGKRLASCSADRSVRIWEIEDLMRGKAETAPSSILRGHTDWLTALAFAKDGKWIASGGFDKTIRIWDAQTHRCLQTLKGHIHSIDSIVALPDGSGLLSAGFDGVKRWKLPLLENAELQYARTLAGHKFLVTDIDYAPDGERLVSCSLDGLLKIWNVEEGTELRSWSSGTERLNCCEFDTTGRALACGGDDALIKVWKADSGELTHELRGHSAPVMCLAYLRDGKRLISGSGDGMLVIWDIESKRPLHSLPGHLKRVASLAIAPDEKSFVSVADDSRLRIWNTETGKPIKTIETDGLRFAGCQYSPDGKCIAVGCLDRTIRVFETATGNELALLKGHSDIVYGVCFSSDGRRMATVSADKTLKLWDAAKWEEIFTLRGHEEWIGAVQFSPNDLQLATCSFDATIKLWGPSKTNP